MKKYKRTLLLLITVVLVLLIFVGCSSDQIISPPAKTIEKIGSVVLLNDGKFVASIENKKVNGIVFAELAKESAEFEALFYNENGELMEYDPQEYKLAWNVDFKYAAIERHSQMEFCIFGKKQGNTSFKLFLETNRGIAYSSPGIPLEVTKNW